MITPIALESVREAYEARDYQQVVQALSALPREVLLQSLEQAYMLADAGRRAGGVDDLAALLDAIVAAARAQENTSVLCRALNLHGVVLLEQGQAAAAERAWCDLVIVATSADDPHFVARASNNLGVAAIVNMRLETAITNFQRAISSYIRLGYARGCAQAHQNLGIIYREMNHVQDAHKHFDNAITFARTADCIDDVARAEQETALLMVYAGEDLERAEQFAQQALHRFAELKQPGGTAEALRVVGVVALARGRADEAQQALNDALRIAQELKLRILEAETLLGLARLARLQQDAPRSYTMQQQAEKIFADMDAQPWGEQVRRRMDALVMPAAAA
jgi:tetratricopeptide (TPR) repeat protein